MRVSVVLTSCDRDRFLVEALTSVVGQQLDGDWEVVVGDDGSGPRTREILAEFRDRHPGRIRIVRQERRVGLSRNFAAAFEVCRGEYVALIDDDDLWTSPEKMRLQCEDLDAHPECTVSFHVSRHFHEDGSAPDSFLRLRRQARFYDLDDLRDGGFIPTSATMLRRSAVAPLPDWFVELRSHEWPLQLLAARHGAVSFLDEVLSATRIHSAGDYNGRSAIDQHHYSTWNIELLRRHLDFMDVPATSRLLAREYYELATKYRYAGDFDRAMKWCWRSLLERGTDAPVPLGTRLRLLGDALLHAADARLRYGRR